VNLLFASEIERPERWLPLLAQALPRDRFFLAPEADIDIAIVATPPPGTLAKLRRPKLIQSLWMGVERLVADPAYPKGVPLARIIDPGMVAAMSETVIAHVLDWHRHHYRYRAQQRAIRWECHEQHLAADRTIGLLGLGELGTQAALRLRGLGFRACGWSRRPKALEGIETFSGSEGLSEMVAQSDALICLLPLTPQTRGILDARLLSRLRPGGCVINVARGGHLVASDLMAALDRGALAHAYLDVFEPEPLPADDPLWRHPAVTLTPHAAAATEPRTAVAKIVENVERVRRGEPPRHLVDFESGY
jgi:glyoxylate/hydroxypyruvate reductase A